MGALAPLRQLAYSLLAFISWLANNLMLGRRKLHGARFARLYELDGLTGAPPAAPHLLLGVTHLNQPLAVKPTRARRELGNLLVVAPTRGGKGLRILAQTTHEPTSKPPGGALDEKQQAA